MNGLPPVQGLYNPAYEHDSCGVGFICHIKGKPSHQIVSDALQMLENMNHRGACGCEEDSGDGAGILVQTPDAFFRRECGRLNFTLPPAGQYGVGMIFLPQDAIQRHMCERILERVARDNGMKLLGWRDVPVDSRFVGPTPKAVEPRIRQIFLSFGDIFFNRKDFDRRLYLVRQRAENEIEFGQTGLTDEAREQFYICILSGNRMIYKGMLTATQLQDYYLDLKDPEFASALAMVHSRFSTNTFPSWQLAHPFRYLAHNGEINTLRGNRNWMRARYGALQSEAFGDELQKMFPILTESGSDSATLDNMIQFLAVNGRSLPHAMLMAIPEAWQNNTQMEPDLRAFYEYHACLMEPWDGPASISFTNGQLIGAVLDRNGLRPSRFYVTKDDLVIMASEVGVLPIPPDRILRKWRLQPGKIFMIDLRKGKIVDDADIKQELVDKRPWKKWLDANLLPLDSLPDPTFMPESNPDKLADTLAVRQHAFGYTTEDIKFILGPMAGAGIEGLGSMGTDTPLACLSDRPQLLYNYFKQLFAQVTNPPLDANFEALVTSLFTYLGREGNLLDETPKHCRLIKLTRPVLSNLELAKLREVKLDGADSVVVPMTFKVGEGEAGLARAVDALCEEVLQKVTAGASVVILSDRGVDKNNAPIPSLLATAAVHHFLIKKGVRTQCGLVIETGEAREPHHFCLLIGYGAGAVNPYLALETLAALHAEGMLPDGLTAGIAEANYIKAANKSIIKVASKMGISTVQSYRGAQIFEAVGIAAAVIDKYFTGTASRIQGVTLEIIARESLMRHHRGYPTVDVEGQTLDPGGNYQWRRDGEFHQWNPDTVAKLQQAVRVQQPITGYPTYKDYARLVNDESKHRCTIRGLMTFKRDRPPVKLDDVEPATSIVKRFVTGAMSLGSISRESHETIAIAMNQIGGKSNTGEGGEDPVRFTPDPPDKGGKIVSRRSAIKQVASARFGVTAEYLVNADQLQIKLAQGAKPGEGGQLPGHKVDEYIGKIRHSTPGVGLISPPPHHDIYSIEDLAQLIHDLKSVNPAARISVKLVSEVGVGTVAAGVAKTKADHILISGDGGGTGASPLTSIKHAGLPWELGLAETQQTLVMNGLRGRVVIEADGQLKTGRDVAIAALLGAEEFGFSTAPLIASGCIMMRVCHLNTCPVGIATQDPELRRKFAGKPEHVVNFMFFVAEELREIMAELGFTKLDDMVGRTDLLDFVDLSSHWKARHVDLLPVLFRPGKRIGDGAIRNVARQDHALGDSLDNTRLLKLAKPAIDHGTKVFPEEQLIKNTDRSVGTTLSGVIARKYGHAGLPEDTIRVKFHGHAGQSFGCFLAHGVTFLLEGDANDYVGKGMSGGRIAVFPPKSATFDAGNNIIAGNTCLYGATEGELFLRGVAGERFAVRNSGASAVVEGVGDHGCEYMTGGTVVVIGPTGRNFAAGMSGGIAYVYDDAGTFPKLANRDLVTLDDPLEESDKKKLRELLTEHHQLTGSTRARAILDDWDNELRYFVKVMPNDYKKALMQRASKGIVTPTGA
jgi:glutamate synthase domain-containing protein 2/glutamate synthase domain-containing protein 1/glutamate synthase domain-containing protein 3